VLPPSASYCVAAKDLRIAWKSALNQSFTSAPPPRVTPQAGCPAASRALAPSLPEPTVTSHPQTELSSARSRAGSRLLSAGGTGRPTFARRGASSAPRPAVSLSAELRSPSHKWIHRRARMELISIVAATSVYAPSPIALDPFVEDSHLVGLSVRRCARCGRGKAGAGVDPPRTARSPRLLDRQVQQAGSRGS
jgi:hypothetical protein